MVLVRASGPLGEDGMDRKRSMLGLAVLWAAAAGPGFAATPPTLVNYQGVLRDAADAPLTGSYDMRFRFWDAASGGVEIMIDEHTALTGSAVAVTQGLFDVLLGGGAVADGWGPGSYTSVDAVFRDHAEVWLGVSIGGETLEPRTRIHSTPYALNALLLAGKPANFYLDTSASPQTKLGPLVVDSSAAISGFGVEATGPEGGGHFQASDNSGYCYVGYGEYGIQGFGNFAGGYFEDPDSTAYAYAGSGDIGVEGYGSASGAYFQDTTGPAYASVASGAYGIQAHGNGVGGLFTNASAQGFAYVAEGGYGIRANGVITGGYFGDAGGSGYAYVGFGDRGIEGVGNDMGGYFRDGNGTGYAYVGRNNIGIEGYGSAGGFFQNPGGSYAHVGYSVYKIEGTGTVSFVQNHPTRDDRVVVYAAPEGDEVAVYTRGSARLVGGTARVALGETFSLVANPDLGLTAHLTPRGAAALWVDEVSPSEIVVRGSADVDFDYIVYGLRIGFENVPIVQVKRDEAYLPTADALAELEAGQLDTVASSALARFGAAHEQLAGAPADLSRASALATRINSGREEWIAAILQREEQRRGERDAAQGTATRSRTPGAPEHEAASPVRTPDAVGAHDCPVGTTLVLQAAQATEVGAVVSLDPLRPGVAVRSSTPGAPLVVGCALVGGEGEIAIATAGVALCRADAWSTPIGAGDLLVASSLEGHAMKHDGRMPAAAILGRAVDPLQGGAASIRVLLGAR